MIALFEEPEDETVPPDMADNYVGTEENTGYSTAYSQLVYASKQDVDPFKEIDARRFLVQSLKSLSQAHPGKVSGSCCCGALISLLLVWAHRSAVSSRSGLQCIGRLFQEI